MTAQGSFSLVLEVLSGVAPAEQDESRMNSGFPLEQGVCLLYLSVGSEHTESSLNPLKYPKAS